MGERPRETRIKRRVAWILPLVLLGGVVVWQRGGSGRSGPESESGPPRLLSTAEASVVSIAATFRGSHRPGGDARRRRSQDPRGAVVDQLRLRKPVFAGESAPGGIREITIAKSSAPAYEGIDFGLPRREWHHLTREVRRVIDAAAVVPGRWSRVVVHNSSTRRGNARALDYYHRHVKGLPEGLAYHFVIGNGSYSGVGEVEVGDRWRLQIPGAGVTDGAGESAAIEICLVGDFDAHRVDDAQLAALDELIDYLEARCGELVVTTHRHGGRQPDGCPGRFFPDSLVVSERTPTAF